MTGDRGIIMGDESVYALIAGTKWQTRRLANPQPTSDDLDNVGDSERVIDMATSSVITPRYRVGDELWVREAFALKLIDPTQYLYGKIPDLGIRKYGGGAPEHRRDLRCRSTDVIVEYRAHPTSPQELAETPGFDTWRGDEPDRWRPALFMPRWAARLWLRVAWVRLEPLHAITEEDAKAEGVHPAFEVAVADLVKHGSFGRAIAENTTYRTGYRLAWNRINPRVPWSSNPFVWVYGFATVTTEKYSPAVRRVREAAVSP